MFTGIVEELGEVIALEHLAEAARITVRGPVVTAGAKQGDSIAVNGVCLTVTALSGTAPSGTALPGTAPSGREFTADVMAETLRRTGLGTLAPGSPVNLERPLKLGDRLGGHMVQGHVDALATVLTRSPAKHWDVVRIAVPPGLGRYIVAKGSVAVDGVSLTVSAVGGDPPWFEVSLIPATLAATTLGRVQPGSAVNLEVDVIGKYVENMLRETAVRS